MKRIFLLGYGFFSYISFLVGACCLFLLLNNIAIYNMNCNENVSGITPWITNVALLLLFFLSHSLPARLNFKQFISFSPVIERNTYVLISGLVLICLSLFWQPLPGKLWQLPSHSIVAILLNSIGYLGWIIFIVSTFAISHSDLFGLRHTWLQWNNKVYTDIPFKNSGLYQLVRHPMMTGFLLAFWFTSDMTSGRLLFNIGMTIYIFYGIYLEETDLKKTLGEDYHQYLKNVPKVIPKLSKK